MAEHLDADLLSRRPADMLFLHLTEDVSHLLHVQLTRQHHDIGKLGIEAQGLDVGDVELGGEVHLLSHAVAIGHHSHIAGDDGRDTCLMGSVDDLMHQGDILAINDGVDREIALDAMLLTSGGHLFQVVDGEGGGRVGPHVQFLDAEIYAVGPSLDGCCQRLARAHWRHNFKILNLHGCKFTNYL